MASSGLMFSLSLTDVILPGVAELMPVPGVTLPGAARGVAPPGPALGVRKGVPRTVLGVATVLGLGVNPSKLRFSVMGVFMPPFKGVSTLVSAIRFCASCKIVSRPPKEERG